MATFFVSTFDLVAVSLRLWNLHHRAAHRTLMSDDFWLLWPGVFEVLEDIAVNGPTALI